jgi:glycosyltransferase involved in cell wall biosynthesis
MGAPRVALFTDSYHEANGVARTAHSFEAFAASRERPLLVVQGGRVTQLVESGSVARLELNRWPRTSVALEHDLWFDVSLWRHARRVAAALRWFRPDVLHFTGPSDIGQLGMLLGYRLGVPMVGSWHTNLHEYASRRLLHGFKTISDGTRKRIGDAVESRALAMALLFYTLPPRVVLAPNQEWKSIIERRTGKPTFVMTRGVDTDLFTPVRRRRTDVGTVKVGYVGRLSAEKNVRALAAVDASFKAAGIANVRFIVVGDGAERQWLQEHMPDAEFTGVLRGDPLADAYADLDLFVFPSETETVGNVVLEAMASGVPVVAMAYGGTKFVAASPASAALARSERELIEFATRLVRDGARRRAMGVAARAAALERSWAAVFDVVYEAYAAAIARDTGGTLPAGESIVTVAEQQSA